MFLEGGEDIHDEEWIIDADAKTSALQRRLTGDDIARLRDQPEDLLAHGEQVLARVRQFQAMAAAMEEGDPVILLERLQLAGDGRLGHIQEIRSLGEAAGGGDGMESAQLCEVHLSLPPNGEDAEPGNHKSK